MAKKLTSKEETMVLIAVKEIKQGTLKEIQEKIKGKWKTEIETGKMVRYLGRWKKGKAIAANLVNKEWVYSLRDIPWLPEAQMIHILKPDVSEAEASEFLNNYKEELKNRGYAIQREPDIRDYQMFEITMEVIDCIAGGTLQDGEKGGEDDAERRLLYLPRNWGGQLVIPRSWIVGFFRDNARLINMPPSIKWTLATGPGEFIGDPKIKVKTVIGKKGPQSHETVGPGTQFKFNLSYPMHGTKIKTKEQLETFFKKIAITPVKGFGAYDRAFGGRVKLVEMKEID